MSVSTTFFRRKLTLYFHFGQLFLSKIKNEGYFFGELLQSVEYQYTFINKKSHKTYKSVLFNYYATETGPPPNSEIES